MVSTLQSGGSMKTFTLFAITLTLATACKKDEAKNAAADPKAQAKPTDPRSADPKPADPKPADPKAEADKGAALAVEMCGKEMDAVQFSDLKTHDKLVAQLRHPRDPEDYSKDGLYPWVATRAAVVEATDTKLVITIVPDDTDPCAIKNDAELITAAKNPAAQIRIFGVKPGDYQNWSAAETWPAADIFFGATKAGVYESGGFRGMSLFRVTKVDSGKTVELEVHACEAQAGELMGGAPKHFAIGHVTATWCPQ